MIDREVIVSPDALERLARDFDSVAKTFREVRLHGLATEAESHKLIFEVLAFQAKHSDWRAA